MLFFVLVLKQPPVDDFAFALDIQLPASASVEKEPRKTLLCLLIFLLLY